MKNNIITGMLVYSSNNGIYEIDLTDDRYRETLKPFADTVMLDKINKGEIYMTITDYIDHETAIRRAEDMRKRRYDNDIFVACRQNTVVVIDVNSLWGSADTEGNCCE